MSIDGSIPVGYIEVLHPGIAYTWTDDATGLKILTNLRASDCNRRPGDADTLPPLNKIVYFKTDEQLWGWAKRVSEAADRAAHHRRSEGVV